MSGLPKSDILESAAMAEDARAMGQAMLDGDLEEARFRAGLLHRHALLVADGSLVDAASQVLQLLGPPGAHPRIGSGAAMLLVSSRLGYRLG